MSDDIAREAQKVRVRDAKATSDRKRAAQEAAESDARVSLRERDARAEVLRDSVAPLGRLGIAVIVGFLLAAGFGGMAAISHGDEVSFTVILVCVLVIMGLTFALVVAVPRVVARFRLAALGRIGHGFDPWAYRSLMSEKRSTGVLVITLGFAGELDDKRGRQIADAMRGWVPELAHATWDDTRLVLRSQRLDGSQGAPPQYGEYRYVQTFSNRAFHRVVMRVVRRALPKLDPSARVARFDVAIEGKVERWDA